MKLRSIGHTRPQAPVARAKAARIKSSQPRLKGRAVRKQTSNRSLISREKKFADNYLHTNTQIADLKSKMNQRYDILANKEQLKKDYGLLGILRDCSDEQLKEAYKRESLAKHPDKNPGNEEAAKIRFQELQNAYERINIARNKANEAEV